MTYEAGAWRIPTLTVDPADDTTTALLEIEAPDGTVTAATPTPGDTRGSWSAPAYQLTAGQWIERWTVTGTGAGAARFTVQVAGDPGDPIPGAYATVGQLNKALGRTPAGAAQLIVRASRDVDRALLTAVYDPADPKVVAALREATLEQVAAHLVHGNVTGLGGTRRGGFSIGRLTVQAASTDEAPVKIGTLWEQAWTVLQSAGLTGHAPRGR